MKKNKKQTTIKEDLIEVEGIVKEALPGCKFKVLIENVKSETEVVCTLSGKLRINKIIITEGDKVELKLSPYDVHSGIITWRK